VAQPSKNKSNKPISNFKYKFTKAGDYKVVFMASNNTPNSIKVKIKEIYITINP
jgi:PKD repeat protein